MEDAGYAGETITPASAQRTKEGKVEREKVEETRAEKDIKEEAKGMAKARGTKEEEKEDQKEDASYAAAITTRMIVHGAKEEKA